MLSYTVLWRMFSVGTASLSVRAISITFKEACSRGFGAHLLEPQFW